MPETVPSTPDLDWNTVVFDLLRTLLKVGAGMGVTIGAVSDSQLTVIASLLVGIAAYAWGLYRKKMEAVADHAGNVASAAAGVPRKVES